MNTIYIYTYPVEYFQMKTKCVRQKVRMAEQNCIRADGGQVIGMVWFSHRRFNVSSSKDFIGIVLVDSIE